jgi:hypothetical protein
MEANPGGLVANFKGYFDQLPKDKLKVNFLLDPHVHMFNVALFVLVRNGKRRRKLWQVPFVSLDQCYT